MGTHVLVPVDGSPLSEQALETALVEHPDATITALHIIDPTDVGYNYFPYDSTLELEEEPLHGSEEWYDRAEELADELFADIEETASEYDRDLETAVVVGEPGRAIVDYATDHDVDHIFIGSHGRDEESRVLLGSITEAVAFRAPMRVTLVRYRDDWPRDAGSRRDRTGRYKHRAEGSGGDCPVRCWGRQFRKMFYDP